MSLKKTLDRNRQMKKIAQSVAQKWEKATIYSIDGDRANIRLGSSANLIRHVEVTGNASLLVPGQEVVIVWKDKRPVVVMAGTALAASLSQEGVSEQTPLFIKLYQSVAQSAATATETYLTFDTVLADTVGWWDPTAPDRIIVQESGLYFISVDISFASNATGVREAKIYVNDAEIGRSQAAAGSSAVVVHNAVFAMLDKGDIVQADMYQNSGGALATVVNAGTNAYPAFTLARIRDTVTVQQTGDTTILNQGTGGGGSSGPHAATHEQGGSDMINVDGLRGVLAEAQNAEKLRGRSILDAVPNDGNIYVWNNFMQSWAPADLTGLKGVLADPQNANKLLGRNISTDDVYDGHILQWSEADNAWMPRVNRPSVIPVHAVAHQDGGGDEINVTGLSGTLADPQNANKIQGRGISTAAPSDGQALGWNAAISQWEPKTVSGGGIASAPFGLSIILGDGSLTMSTGMKGYLEVPYNCTLTEVRLYSDVSGSCLVDIWKGTYASLPASGGTICSSTRPALSSQQTYQDTALIGWTKSLMAGDVLAINVVSATTVKQVTLALKGTKS